MRKSKFSENQIVAILQEGDEGVPVPDVCRKYGISRQTFYRWRSKYGGMTVPELKQKKNLEVENRRLKQIVGDQALDIQALKAALSKKY